MARTGRPTKNDEERMERMTIYMKPADQEALANLAEKKGTNVSSFVRMVLLERLERESYGQRA